MGVEGSEIDGQEVHHPRCREREGNTRRKEGRAAFNLGVILAAVALRE